MPTRLTEGLTFTPSVPSLSRPREALLLIPGFASSYRTILAACWSASTGLIDEGYTGTIKVKVYNHGYDPYTFQAGEKVSQLLVFPVLYPTLEIVDKLSESPRGENGYGSSGQLKGGTMWEV